VVDALNALPERARFMKGLFDWVGFTQATVDYAREARSGGASKWRYWRLWNFALDGLTGSSTAPLRVWTYVGAAASLAAFAYAALLIVRTLVSGVDVPGYASLMVVVLMFGGLNLLSLGIIGEYLGRTYMEVKQRPLYVVRRSIGLAGPDPESVQPAETEVPPDLAGRRLADKLR
jgi:polyisoprenyl-phosphate glycosyltransferase